MSGQQAESDHIAECACPAPYADCMHPPCDCSDCMHGSTHLADCPRFEVEDGAFGDPMSNPSVVWHLAIWPVLRLLTPDHLTPLGKRQIENVLDAHMSTPTPEEASDV